MIRFLARVLGIEISLIFLYFKEQVKAYLGRPPNSHSPQMYGPRYKVVE